jgi:hypothetical protein
MNKFFYLISYKINSFSDLIRLYFKGIFIKLKIFKDEILKYIGFLKPLNLFNKYFTLNYILKVIYFLKIHHFIK